RRAGEWVGAGVGMPGVRPTSPPAPADPAARHLGWPPLLRGQRGGFGGYGPPLLVAGTGERVLSTAAAYADIVGIAGTRQVAGQPPGTFRLCTAAEADDLVAFARSCAGPRAVEWQGLVQLGGGSGDRGAVAGGRAEPV